jgi:hypothetical protein
MQGVRIHLLFRLSSIILFAMLTRAFILVAATGLAAAQISYANFLLLRVLVPYVTSRQGHFCELLFRASGHCKRLRRFRLPESFFFGWPDHRRIGFSSQYHRPMVG